MRGKQCLYQQLSTLMLVCIDRQKQNSVSAFSWMWMTEENWVHACNSLPTYEVYPRINRLLFVQVNKTVGMINLASPVGVVNLAPPVGLTSWCGEFNPASRLVNLATPVGVVNLAPTGVVNLAPPIGVVNLAPPCSWCGELYVVNVHPPVGVVNPAVKF